MSMVQMGVELASCKKDWLELLARKEVVVVLLVYVQDASCIAVPYDGPG